MDEAGDGISELGFFVADAVAADHCAIGLHHFGEAAGKDAFENGEVGFVGEAHEGERGEGPSSHGIDVAKGVGGGDLAEGVGIVDDGREEVDGLNERLVRSELIHSGVVGVIEAD